MRVRATLIDDDGNIVNIVGSNREQILAAADVEADYTWADWGTDNARITSIVYSSATVLPGHSATKTFTYTLSSGSYRLDNVAWSYT